MREPVGRLRIGPQPLEHLAALRPGQFAVEQCRQQLGRCGVVRIVRRCARFVVHHVFPITRSAAVPCVGGSPDSSARICSRARDSRDITVPTGTPST
jgi:O-acetyl-ADP-ribose deacetylase (regulator of RNase III)